MDISKSCAQQVSEDQKVFLDDLPAELKTLILLEAPNLSTLYSLVRSSPSFHKCYTRQRHQILCAILHSELDSDIIFEAREVYDADQNRSRRSTYHAVLKYQQLRRLQSTTIFTPSTLNTDTIIQIVRLHSVIGSLTSKYCTSVLHTNPMTGFKNGNHQPPSRTELRRLYRSFYHVELLCIWYGPNSDGLLDSDMRPSPNLGNAADMGKFTAWEMEEVACIREYMIDTYATVLDECLAFVSDELKLPSDMVWERNPFVRKGTCISYTLCASI
jgi:hypothetical protein